MPKNKPEESALALQVTIEGKDPKLPRFVVIPAKRPATRLRRAQRALSSE